MSAALDRVKQLKKEYEAAVRSVGQDGIKEVLAGLFERFPAVKRVRWTQYTPYFNDGDPCNFRCNASDCTIDFGNEDAGDDEDGFEYSSEANPGAFDEFGGALAEIDDDIFLSVFGDHTEITADRNGFTVDEYDHS